MAIIGRFDQVTRKVKDEDWKNSFWSLKEKNPTILSLKKQEHHYLDRPFSLRYARGVRNYWRKYVKSLKLFTRSTVSWRCLTNLPRIFSSNTVVVPTKSVLKKWHTSFSMRSPPVLECSYIDRRLCKRLLLHTAKTQLFRLNFSAMQHWSCSQTLLYYEHRKNIALRWTSALEWLRLNQLAQ